jgi:hypothetical protein
MSGQRLVLKSKATGKIASRSDQSKKAIVLKAFELAKECQNTGIPSLLAPKSTKEKAEIAAIGAKYDVSIVKTRSGEKSGASDKKRLFEASKNDNLFAKLAVHFEKFVGDNPKAHALSAKAFSRWLKTELSKKESTVYLIAIKYAPVLLEAERNDRWWADAYAKRRKSQS